MKKPLNNGVVFLDTNKKYLQYAWHQGKSIFTKDFIGWILK